MRIKRAGEVQFNALGEPTRQIDAAGRVVLRGFDASGRPTKSTNLLYGAPEGGPTATSEDRKFRYQGGVTVKQRQAVVDGMSYPDTTQYITYKSNPNGFDSISGTVDAQAYLNWLDAHGYGINMTVQ